MRDFWKRWLGLRAAPAALLLAFCSMAWAEEAQQPQPDLYMQALQALSDGRLDDAKDAIARLSSRQPRNAGEWLDLAILFCGIGDAQEAGRLFAEIEAQFAPEPGIVEMMAGHRAQGCRSPEPRFTAALSLGRGYDSNANQGASNLDFVVDQGGRQLGLVLAPQYAPRADRFTWLSADMARQASPAGATGYVQFQGRVHDVESAYDMGVVNVGAAQPWLASGMAGMASASASWMQLGGKPYQQQLLLQLLAAPQWGQGAKTKLNVVTDWALVTYPTLTAFDAYVWQLRGVLSQQAGAVALHASGGLAYDRQAANRPGGDRRGWSISAGGETGLGERMVGALGWSRQTWLSQTGYSPGFIDQQREQQTNVLRASLALALKTGQSLKLEFRQVDNHENISIFVYNSRILQLSWEWRLGR